MYFQQAGSQNIFVDNKITSQYCDDLTHTWYVFLPFANRQLEYAYLYSQGKSLEEACPDEIKDKWSNLKKLHKAFEKSFKQAKIRITIDDFYKNIPFSFVKDYFMTKNKIAESVFGSYERPKDYQYLIDLEYLLSCISTQPIKIDLPNQSNMDDKLKRFCDRFGKNISTIRYKSFGTITGRLTTYRKSFPILTLDKQIRNCIKPHYSWFLELDYNAAEIRTFLALNDKPQPQEDIHNWHSALYNNNFSREEIKKMFFAWFYNGDNVTSSGNKTIDETYNKLNVLNKYWDGKSITNPYGRTIQATEYYATSYLIQSTTWDIFSRQAAKINNFIRQNNLKSRIVILLHDNVVIDLHKEDVERVNEFRDIFSNTDFGMFKVNSKLGKSLGNMESF